MPNVALSLGPILLGVFANMILYGVLIVQTFIYYRTYKKDALLMKLFVLYLFIVETANTGFDMAIVYEPLILRYGTPHATTYFPMMFPTEPIMIVAVSTPIQLFLAWRIWLITKGNWIPAIICFLSIVSFGGGVWTCIKIVILKRFVLKPELHASALLWFTASCVVDVIITASLVWSLSRRKTGFRDTDSAIDRIIRMTVQTGMLTSIAAIGDVVFFTFLPHTALNFLWDLPLSKIYTNSLLSTLNARAAPNNLTGSHANVLFSDVVRQIDNTNNSTIVCPPIT